MQLGITLALSRPGGLASLPIPSDGLVAWYAFDEGAGQTAFDQSGNGYNARLGATTGADANDPQWIRAGIQCASDDYVFASGLPLGGSAFSVVVAAYPTVAGAGAIRIYTSAGESSDRVILQRYTDNAVRVYVSMNGQGPTASTWNGPACVGLSYQTNSTCRVYRNGNQIMTLSGAGASALDRFKFLDGTGNGYYLLFYNRYLSGAEHQQLYKAIRQRVGARGVWL